jgi:hypothetical protein
MNIQNISGADAVPTGYSENSRVSNDGEKSAHETKVQEHTEEHKGENIDTYA